jgi:hypothetical protein
MKFMSPLDQSTPANNSVTILQAALIARVHVSNLYKLREKLGAFKHEGVWRIPTETLQKYIAERSARAREILAGTPVVLDQQ